MLGWGDLMVVYFDQWRNADVTCIFDQWWNAGVTWWWCILTSDGMLMWPVFWLVTECWGDLMVLYLEQWQNAGRVVHWPDGAVSCGDDFDEGRHVGVAGGEVDVETETSQTIRCSCWPRHQGPHHVHAILILQGTSQTFRPYQSQRVWRWDLAPPILSQAINRIVMFWSAEVTGSPELSVL